MTASAPFLSDNVIQGRYRHYRGSEYQVLGSATHSETLEKFVVYQALYGEYGVWVRPYAMFFENVQVGETTVPRFTKAHGE